MKAWTKSKLAVEDGAWEGPESALADKATATPALEKPVAVKVPPRPLLDVPLTMERFNPNCCATLLSTVITAATMGLCFVVVGVPPLFLDDWKGKRIYVGVMVPLLTLLCTVLLYYVMQQPQRSFNTALMKIVKEMEHHSHYLTTAVDNVEKELNARGVNLNAVMGNTNTPSFDGRPRSRLATPDESAMQQAQARGPGSFSPKSSALRNTGNFTATGGTNFLHGIDKLDETHDVVIATVHVGKEWKWFTEMLCQLRKTTMAGPNFPGLAYQKVMVRMLTVAIARVEKLVLSLYFSSFVLQNVSVLAPLSLWGTASIGAIGGGGGGGANRGDMHARAVAALNNRGTVGAYGGDEPAFSARRSPLHLLGGSGASLTESTSTIENTKNNSAKGGSAAYRESPAFAVAGALDVGGDSESHTELTPPSQTNGYFFGNRVRLPQFKPLIISGEMSPARQPRTTPAAAEGKGVAPARAASSTLASALRRQTSATAIVGAPRTANANAGVLRSASDAETEEDVDVAGEETPSAKVRGDRQAPPKNSTTHSVVVVQNRSTAPADGAADGKSNNGGSEVSPASTTSTQQPRAKKGPSRHVDATPDKQLASFDPTGVPRAVFSPPPTKPPLPPSSSQATTAAAAGNGGRPRRQPGAAVVQNPTLLLHRGARFVNDENAFFVTILVHVRKARLTCFSRLYAAQAHVKEDGKSKQFYFSNSADSSLMRRSHYNPFTFLHISDAAGEREGLTVQEQRLLNVVYCRPENYPQFDRDGHWQPTDLSSLAVKDGANNSSDGGASSPMGEEENSLPSSMPQRNITSVYNEEIDTFIIALGLLADRPMRLTFLPVHVEAVARKVGLSGTFSASLSSLSLKAGPGAAKGSEAGTTPLGSDAPTLPPLKTLPVLECVIDDVLCVLTKMEVTVDSSFQKPSKILLVGVSLEDLSEVSERGVDEEDDLDSLAVAQETKRPVHSSIENSLNERHSHSHSRSMATPQTQALGELTPATTAVGDARGCTVGQEFREVITLGEEESVTAELSMAST